jgi:hypothetical protein
MHTNTWHRESKGRHFMLQDDFRLRLANLALTGRLQDAHKALRLLRDADPTLWLCNLKDRAPFQPDCLARLAEGLGLAGVQE